MRALLRRSGLFLFALLGLFLILFGVLYASVTELLPFHAAAAPQDALLSVRPIYFALMKLIGGASIGLGLLGLYVTFGPLRSGAPGAAAALAFAFAVPVALAGYVAEMLAKTGAPTSADIMLVLLAIDAAALALTVAAQPRRALWTGAAGGGDREADRQANQRSQSSTTFFSFFASRR